MFLKQAQIQEAIRQLENLHPFYGTTFLVCKINHLPVAGAKEILLSQEEQAFLERYYKPNPDTAYFFRVFRVSDKKTYWLGPKYVHNTLHPTRTNGRFKNAFIHLSQSSQWGWHEDYVQILRSNLDPKKLIPTYHLAVWLFRFRKWPKETTAQDIIQAFLTEFHITDTEKSELFDAKVPNDLGTGFLLQDEPVSWADIVESMEIPAPPDIQDESGALAYLELRGVGPAKIVQLDFAERVNLLTGDNGLGKSFILESAWWALSGSWSGFPAYPRDDAKRSDPRIGFRILGSSGKQHHGESAYDWQGQTWLSVHDRPTLPGLLIYARADGSFAVWDPARDYWAKAADSNHGSTSSKPLLFSREEVWNGIRMEVGGRTTFLANGLITDWINWQNRPDSQAFATLTRVLKRLSPPSLEQGDLGILEPGKPTRVPRDSRLIPTIKHSYGEIPLIQASAGVQRIVSMAYLIVWAWEEHKNQSQLIRKEPQRRLVILIDEIESHLHPQWQRRILPALLDVHEDLDSELKVQLLVATHSPLVMASVEPRFDAARDKIFHLNLVKEDLFLGRVEVEEPDFVVYGTTDSWLRSELFELRQARSLEAEEAIEKAKKLQMRDEVSSDEVQEVSEQLMQYLGAHDLFWPRWTFFAERHGVAL